MSNTFTTETASFPNHTTPFDTVEISGKGVNFTGFESVKPHASLDIHRVTGVSALEVTTSLAVSISLKVVNENGIKTTVTLFGVTRDQLIDALADAEVVK